MTDLDPNGLREATAVAKGLVDYLDRPDVAEIVRAYLAASAPSPSPPEPPTPCPACGGSGQDETTKGRDDGD